MMKALMLCFSLSLLLFAVCGEAKYINWKINLGGDSVDNFMGESEVLTFGEETAKTRFHGKIKGSSSDKEVFKTQRFAREKDLSINVPVPDGVYSVTLMFAETWNGAFGRGKRVFDVYLGSIPTGIVKIIDGMDPYMHGGAAGPVRRTFRSLPTQGGLTVLLRPIKQNPQIAGIIVKGYSYSDVFLEDLPVVQLDVARSEDFSILDRITSGSQKDLSAIYGTSGAIPNMNQPGMGPEASTGDFNPMFAQAAAGPFAPGMGMEGSLGAERQMEVPVQHYGQDSGEFGQTGNMDQAIQHSGQTLRSSTFPPGPPGVRTSLPIHPTQNALPGVHSRMAIPQYGGAPSSVDNLRRVYHRHLASIPHEYEAEEQGFGMENNGPAKENHMSLPHTNTKTASNTMEPYTEVHHDEIPTIPNSVHIDIQDHEDENQLEDISAVSRAMIPHLESGKSEASSWNIGSNPTAFSTSTENRLSSTPPQVAPYDSSVVHNAAAVHTMDQGTGAQSHGIDERTMNQMSSDIIHRRVSGFEDSNGATSNSVSNSNTVIESDVDYNNVVSRQESTDNASERILLPAAAEQKLKEIQQEIGRSNLIRNPNDRVGRQIHGRIPSNFEQRGHLLSSMDSASLSNVANSNYMTKVPYQDSITSSASLTENSTPPTAAERQVIEMHQSFNQVDMKREPESSISAHLSGYAHPQQRFVGYQQPVKVEDVATTTMGSDHSNAMPLDMQGSQFRPSSSNIGEDRNYEIASSVPGYLSSEEHILQTDSQPNTESTVNSISLKQASSEYENNEPLGTSSNFGRKALNVIQSGIKLLSGYVDDDSNYSTPHDDRLISDADGTINNINQQDRTLYQNVPIIQSDSEVKFDSTSNSYDTDSVEDNDVAGKFDGICLHNSTHCTCGMLDERLRPAEECLFIMNENASPMICARRACNAKLVCACAPGATTICKRTEIKTILVPATVNHHVSSEPNVVFCKREQLDNGIGVLTPIL